QKSTSRPVQLPCASGRPKPPSVPLAPQLSMPRDLTVLSVWAEAAVAVTATAAARASLMPARFIAPLRAGVTDCASVGFVLEIGSLVPAAREPCATEAGRGRSARHVFAKRKAYPLPTQPRAISERSLSRVKGLTGGRIGAVNAGRERDNTN